MKSDISRSNLSLDLDLSDYPVPNISPLPDFQYRTPSPGFSSLIGNSPSSIHQLSSLEESFPSCVHPSTITCQVCLGLISPKHSRVRGPPEIPNVGVGHGRKVNEWCSNRPDEDLKDTVEDEVKPDNTDQVFYPKKIHKPANPMILRRRSRVINYKE
jgi:hypothetical protein